MNEKRRTSVSKFLSLILRHKPEEIGLTLKPDGWADVSELLERSASHGNPLTLAELREVVETSDKRRFAFDESGARIRANQGHSIAVEIEFEKRIPPAALYHGTAERNIKLILTEGLKKMQRHHVHLSENQEAARAVGTRYGKPAILVIDTLAMIREGFEFYVSANDVWLVECVPPQFLKVL